VWTYSCVPEVSNTAKITFLGSSQLEGTVALSVDTFAGDAMAGGIVRSMGGVDLRYWD